MTKEKNENMRPRKGGKSWYLEKEIPHREILSKQASRFESKAKHLYINIIRGIVGKAVRASMTQI